MRMHAAPLPFFCAAKIFDARWYAAWNNIFHLHTYRPARNRGSMENPFIVGCPSVVFIGSISSPRHRASLSSASLGSSFARRSLSLLPSLFPSLIFFSRSLPLTSPCSPSRSLPILARSDPTRLLRPSLRPRVSSSGDIQSDRQSRKVETKD